MKINSKIKSMSVYHFKEFIPKYLQSVSKNKKDKIKANYQRIIILKNNLNSKFLHSFMNSIYFKLANLHVEKITRTKKVSLIKKWGLVIDKMEEIRDWCFCNNVNPGK